MSYSESTNNDWMWSVLAITVRPFVEAVVNYETEQLVSSPLKYFESRGGTLGYGANLLLRGTTQTLLGGLYTLGRISETLFTRELPDGTEVVEDITELVDTTSRITIGGMLPNDPGFDRALQQKTEDLEQDYQTAMQDGSKTQKEAMESLDEALGGGSITQGGEDKQMTSEEFHAALMLGAHFVKKGPDVYDKLKGSMISRSSSHYPKKGTPQYGLDLPEGLGHLLIGLTDDGDTFFQLESHGVGNPDMSLLTKMWEGANHMMAYGQHITGGMNYVQIGPGGCIAGSEKDGQQVLLN